jgi:ATP-dependent protease ClpP protease subunit
MDDMKRFWNVKAVKNASGDPEGEIMFYGYIADSAYWDDEVSPKTLMNDLKALGNVSRVTVRINSYGGDVFAAHAIFNILKQHAAEIVVRIDGIAASAATIVAMAGDRIVMPSNAMMMIHNPWTMAAGNSEDMRKTAEMLDQVKETIIAAYMTRSGLSRDELSDLMDDETWMMAAEAVEKGFADEVEGAVRVAASIGGGSLVVNGTSFDLSKIRSIPAALFAVSEEVNEMTPENNATSEVVAALQDEGAAVEEEPEAAAAEGTAAAAEEAPVEAAAEEPAAGPAAEHPEDTPAGDPVQDAVKAERLRIKEIQSLARPGAEAVIAAAIESGQSPADTALQILNSKDVRSHDALTARRQDAAALGSVEASAGVAGGAETSGFLASVAGYAKALVAGRSAVNEKD